MTIHSLWKVLTVPLVLSLTGLLLTDSVVGQERLVREVGEAADPTEVAQDEAPAVTEKSEVATDPDEEKNPTQKLYEKMVDAVLEEFRATSRAHLMLQIEEMQKVAGLDEKSVRKLTVAAKGAADKYIEQQANSIKNAINVRPPNEKILIKIGDKQIHPPLAPGAKPPEPKKATRNPLLQFIRNINAGANPVQAVDEQYIHITVSMQSSGMQVRVKQHRSSSSHGFGGGLVQLQQQPVWKKSYDSVITPEQKKKYEEAVAVRKERLRKAAIAYRVGRIDTQLNLNDDQRKQLTDLLMKTVTLQNYAGNMVEWRVRQGLQQIKDDQVAGFLDDAQRQLFQQLKDQY